MSAKAAIIAIQKQHPKKVVLAVPGGPTEIAGEFKKMVNEFICLDKRKKFFAVANLYRNFHQVTDEEVLTLLERLRGKEK